MDNRIRLRVIERPAMGPDGSFTDRSLIIPLNQDPLVFEGERIAPDLCCGHCGAIFRRVPQTVWSHWRPWRLTVLFGHSFARWRNLGYANDCHAIQ
jgi:hypothetical protein